MTKLGYWLSVATIAFGGASLHASQNSHHSCNAKIHEQYVNCFTLVTNEENMDAFNRCLAKYNINEEMASACKSLTGTKLKESVTGKPSQEEKKIN